MSKSRSLDDISIRLSPLMFEGSTAEHGQQPWTVLLSAEFGERGSGPGTFWWLHGCSGCEGSGYGCGLGAFFMFIQESSDISYYGVWNIYLRATGLVKKNYDLFSYFLNLYLQRVIWVRVYCV
jgi:hypothetical protein